jgi:hypothetical protein
MAIVEINVGTTPNDGTGDKLRAAFIKINNSVSYLLNLITTGLANKLDSSAYVQHFKGVHLTLAALQAAHPTGIAGDYAQVDTGSGGSFQTYAYDLQDGWVLSNSDGSGAANTDALTEGSTNLYFTAPRAIASVLTGFSASAGAVSASDTILQAIQKIVGNAASYLTASSTNTLTNKRITNRVDGTTSSAAPAINTDNVDVYKLTAQAVDITSFTINLTGTPSDWDLLIISITGTAARAIAWGASFESSTITLPTTTVTTATLDVTLRWNAATSKWRCVGVA